MMSWGVILLGVRGRVTHAAWRKVPVCLIMIMSSFHLVIVKDSATVGNTLWLSPYGFTVG